MTTLSPKTEILFTLGAPKHFQRDWGDYLQYGFDESDVAALLELIGDKSLHEAPTESDKVWVPLHAWRALGQLRSTTAIKPLANLLDDLSDDDWALSELNTVFRMIGPEAIKVLFEFLMEEAHKEFSRVIAVDSLSKIAIFYPDAREEIVECYRLYLLKPDVSMPFLNGFLMGAILDLNAKELIDEIRNVFSLQCVDISCAGDLEEVEIGLGLRTERSTPKPSIREQFNLPPLEIKRPDSDDLFELLDYYLMRYGSNESILGVSELDGFFAALACSPQTVVPSVWMITLWGGEEFCPEWENKTEIEEFNTLIFQFYNFVMSDFSQNEYEAVFIVKDTQEKTNIIVDDWCMGFLRGMNLWGALSSEDSDAVEDMIGPIILFGTDAGDELLEELDEAGIEQLQQMIEPAVNNIYAYFTAHRKQQKAPKRSEKRAGRNDPCPCGSGKKYKKCCLH